MIGFLISSFAIHLLRFYVIVFLEEDTFRAVLDWAILVVYTVVTFAFLPLFAALMSLLQISLPDLYHRLKCELFTIFTIFISFLASRLYLYADLKFIRLYFKTTTIYSVIPFYTTELVIVVSLSYVLYVSGDMDRGDGRQSEYIESDSSQNIVLVRKE
jgi:hypothetical protein